MAMAAVFVGRLFFVRLIGRSSSIGSSPLSFQFLCGGGLGRRGCCRHGWSGGWQRRHTNSYHLSSGTPTILLHIAAITNDRP